MKDLPLDHGLCTVQAHISWVRRHRHLSALAGANCAGLENSAFSLPQIFRSDLNIYLHLLCFRAVGHSFVGYLARLTR